jgi:membrane-associated phospholipid phosphatase
MEWLKRKLRPEEIITLPFLALMIFFYSYLPLRPNFRPPFVISVILIAGYYALTVAALHLIKKRGGKSASGSLHSVFSFVRDWAPVIVILCVYENLHDVIPYFNRPDHDSTLLRLDTMLLGEPHITVKMQKIIAPLLTDWMHVAYGTLIFYLPFLGCVFYFTQRWKPWRILLLAFTITAFAGFTCYVLVPAVGPVTYLASQYTRALNGSYVAPVMSPIIHNLGIPRDVFPSLHVGYSTVCLLVAYRYSKPCFFVFLPLIINLWFSTLYLRYHYFIDLPAGFLLAVFAVFMSEKIYHRWYEFGVAPADSGKKTTDVTSATI